MSDPQFNWEKAFGLRTPPFLKKKKCKTGIQFWFNKDTKIEVFLKYNQLKPARDAHSIFCNVMDGRDTVQLYKEGMEICQKMIADYPQQKLNVG